MTWKQHPTYSNLETDGIYTRPRIDPSQAYWSGVNGESYGKHTHQHHYYMMGQAHAPAPVQPISYSNSGGSNTQYVPAKPVGLRSSAGNVPAKSNNHSYASTGDDLDFSWAIILAIGVGLVVLGLGFLEGVGFETMVFGATSFAAVAFVGAVLAIFVVRVVWALRWFILFGTLIYIVVMYSA